MKKVNGFIERKSLLYKTKVEYGDFTLNHVQGCSHGCDYPCYAFLMAKRFGRVATFEEWIEPKLVSNYRELLINEIPKFKDKIKSVHLCFTSDPFMNGYDDIKNASVEIIKLLNENGVKCTALTKGRLPKDLIRLSPDNEYGITLVSLDENYRHYHEPNSATYYERISDLKYLHDNGLKTWVSIEPFPTPNIISQDINAILNEIKFVDKIIFGKLNYNKLVSQYKEKDQFYNEMARQVIEFCSSHSISYHIKNGTLKE